MDKIKWAALVVAVIMVVTTVVVAQTGFSDVPEGHPHRQAIEWSRSVGAFQGYGDGTFKPDQKITAEQATIVFGRVYPDGVTRAEFAALLYVGRNLLEESQHTTSTTTTSTTTTSTTTSTTTTTIAALQTTGAWKYFDGETTEGTYEGYYLVAKRPSGLYSHEGTPNLYVRCGVGNSYWDGVFVSTPWLIFDYDYGRTYVNLRYRVGDNDVREFRGDSNEDGDSTVFTGIGPNQTLSDKHAVREAFLNDLANNPGEGKLWLTISGKYDTYHLEFPEILGIRGVIQRLHCFERTY